jgi:orotate phosphoribosyltransferase
VLTASRTVLARDIDSVCRLTGTFELRSGQVATEYFDKYLFESDPQLLRRVVEEMQLLVPEDTELLGGLELGGIPLATMLSSLTGVPALFVRKEAKKYGTRRLAEGAEVHGRRLILIEDIVTTGGAARAATQALRAAGATVEAVVCAIDRSDTPGQALADVEVETHAVFTRADLDAVRHEQGAPRAPGTPI